MLAFVGLHMAKAKSKTKAKPKAQPADGLRAFLEKKNEEEKKVKEELQSNQEPTLVAIEDEHENDKMEHFVVCATNIFEGTSHCQFREHLVVCAANVLFQVLAAKF